VNIFLNTTMNNTMEVLDMLKDVQSVMSIIFYRLNIIYETG